ncbi:MAG: hypothetical protein ACOC1F_05075 [Myxococcota bacterium]
MTANRWMKGAARLVVAMVAWGAVGCAGNAPAPKEPAPNEPVSGECTEIGCTDGLHIDLRAADWEPGAYRFVVDADGRTTTCAGSLPLRPCDAGSSLRCDGDDVLIGESGCALPAHEQGFSDMELPAGPAAVRIIIEHDGAVLADAKLSPEYQRTQPNGPGCPPVCNQARATVEVGR